MRLYGYMLKDEAGVHVPEVVDDLSTDRLLTMTWLDGHPEWRANVKGIAAITVNGHASEIHSLDFAEQQRAIVRAQAFQRIRGSARPGSSPFAISYSSIANRNHS